jgi:hypothetical protein
MYVQYESTMHQHRDEVPSGFLLALYGILQVGRPLWVTRLTVRVECSSILVTAAACKIDV